MAETEAVLSDFVSRVRRRPTSSVPTPYVRNMCSEAEFYAVFLLSIDFPDGTVGFPCLLLLSRRNISIRIGLAVLSPEIAAGW